MQPYLQQFSKRLAGWKGSLVKPGYLAEPHAKEYLGKLAKAGSIERVTWGWYWIPGKEESFLDFLQKDRNFKVISGQTAASFWNQDFIHRNIYKVKVKDFSYGRALEAFARSRGWQVVVEPFAEDKGQYVKMGAIAVESLEDCVIGCVQEWAFADAFAVVYEHSKRIEFQALARKSYWRRVAKSDVRVRQVLSYGCSCLNELAGEKLFLVRKTTIEDSFVKQAIDEAVEKVVALG